VLAYSRFSASPSCAPPGPEFGGSWIEESFANVITASARRITAAATVQLTSSRVLPWIWAGTLPLRLRNLISAYTSAPSTAKKITSAMYRVIM
jgi:hypothetical protein